MTSRIPILAAIFSQLSLLAIGGANVVVPDMQRQFVDVHGWLDGHQFATLVALAQAAPGPNVMVVGLIGWHVAGWLGAAVATLCMCGPSALLSIALGRIWGRMRGSRWGKVLTEGLAPVTVGLVLASGWVLSRSNGFTLVTLLLTAAVTGLALRFDRGGLALLAGAAAIAVIVD